MKNLLLLLVCFQSCIGAGDMFASRKKIIGNYYLVENEGGNYVIGCKVDGGGYIHRSPSDCIILEYGIKDSLLVMHVRFYDSTAKYFILNMNKDKYYAYRDEYLSQEISSKDFLNSPIGTIKLNKVKD